MNNFSDDYISMFSYRFGSADRLYGNGTVISITPIKVPFR